VIEEAMAHRGLLRQIKIKNKKYKKPAESE
jgi:hypothetical protein